MNDLYKKLIEYVGLKKRFSPTMVCEVLNIDLVQAYSFCEMLLQEDPLRFRKWFKAFCPSCNSDSFSGGMKDFERLKNVNCGECGARFELDSNNAQVYYSNSKVASELVFSEGGRKDFKARRENFGTRISLLNGTKNTDEILQINDNFIWHVSDLHFRGENYYHGHGHCPTLVDHFLNGLRKRAEKIKNDFFVFSGDLTDTGSEKDFKKFNEFVNQIWALGADKNNFIFVPGNHDSWEGQSHSVVFLKSLLRFGESTILKSLGKYEIRKMKAPLDSFNNNSSIKRFFKINGLDVELVGINTCIPNEMARGAFPSTAETPSNQNTFKIAVMHHHLIQPVEKDYL